MRTKAVSPLVGVVLLIGIAFAVFVLISSWGTGYVKHATGETGKEFSRQIDCSLASIHADVAIYNATSGNFTLLLENRGSVDFDGLSVSVIFDERVVEKEISQPLRRGEKKVFTVHFEENACNLRFLRIATSCSNAKIELKRSEIKFRGC